MNLNEGSAYERVYDCSCPLSKCIENNKQNNILVGVVVSALWL